MKEIILVDETKWHLEVDYATDDRRKIALYKKWLQFDNGRLVYDHYKVPPSGQYFQCVFGATVGLYSALLPVASASAI
ncbi:MULTISPECIES: hypothetical protein [Sphingobacterium]|uniref:Uncharacterized protein n=1 Tax=Sphingobacterium siyangense TaxID=459529 RepID=A0A562M4K8_9SPHI|nr:MULTISPECIES: hypothetical protein [Sphingobacterium]TWI14887.1 hypothetical protein IQ31_05306 [Sphingobacterium siyangense]